MKTRFIKQSAPWLSVTLLSLVLSACASKPAESTDAVPVPVQATDSEQAQSAGKSPVAAADASVASEQQADGGSWDDGSAGGSWDDDSAGGSWDDDSGDGAVATDPADPWEGFNRAMFSFNDTLDVYFLKPVAKGYKEITPDFMQTGVSNFFSNLGEISNLTNNGLQGKKNGFVVSTWRFVINSTVGVFGLFDVASSLGLREYDEDFGQTLGYWGVSTGPYLVLPFLGPSTVRDASGTAVDYFNYDPVDEFDLNQDQTYGRWALYIVQKRASFLSAESLVFGDRYSFIRDVYLQNRENQVYDGHPPQPKGKPQSGTQGSWGDDPAGDSWGDGTDSWGDDGATDSWGDDTATDSWGDSAESADQLAPSAGSSSLVTPEPIPVEEQIKATTTDGNVE